MNGLTQAQRSYDRQEPSFYLEEDASELGDRVSALGTGEIAALTDRFIQAFAITSGHNFMEDMGQEPECSRDDVLKQLSLHWLLSPENVQLIAGYSFYREMKRAALNAYGHGLFN